MNKKIIFLDIDGTLAMPGRKISKETIDALHKAKENGHYIFINTGRTSKDIPEHIKEVNWDGGVYSAGGKVIINNQDIYNNTLSKEETREIKDFFDENDVNYIFEGINYNYSSREDPYGFEAQEIDLENASTELQRFTKANAGLTEPKMISEYDFNDLVYKTNFRFDPDEVDKLEKIKEKFGDRYRIDIFSNMGEGYDRVMGEMTKFDINKGKGIETVCEYLNIPIENTFAFGDSENDLDMIKIAGTGVAMGNATDIVKKEADIICDTCNNNGVKKALEEFKII